MTARCTNPVRLSAGVALLTMLAGCATGVPTGMASAQSSGASYRVENCGAGTYGQTPSQNLSMTTPQSQVPSLNQQGLPSEGKAPTMNQPEIPSQGQVPPSELGTSNASQPVQQGQLPQGQENLPPQEAMPSEQQAITSPLGLNQPSQEQLSSTQPSLEQQQLPATQPSLTQEEVPTMQQGALTPYGSETKKWRKLKMKVIRITCWSKK